METMNGIGKQVVNGIEYDTFRVEQAPTPVSDLLLILAPPVRLVVWLETVFEQKRKAGADVPDNFVKWLDRWRRIRSDLPSEIDSATQDQWAEVERKVFAR